MKIRQFGYRVLDGQKIPPEAYVVDCRSIHNPYQTGRSDEWLWEQVRKAAGFDDRVKETLRLLRDGHPLVWVGCTFGRHRSVAVAREVLSRWEAQAWTNKPVLEVQWQNGQTQKQ